MGWQVRHAFTVDVEDWHQIYRRAATGWLGPPSESVIRCTHRILDLLDGAGARGTFFVVGLVARAHPRLVREIAARGHEIASHSFAHRRLYELSAAELAADLRRSKRELEDLTGCAVEGFRAPEFSIRSLCDRVFELLVELGFRYDSSIVPSRGRATLGSTVAGGTRHVSPVAPPTPFHIATPAGPLLEFPIATLSLFGADAPLGGSTLRLVPGEWLARAVRALEAAGIPATLYVHPYEFSDELLLPDRLGLRDLARLRWLVLHNFLTSKIDSRVEQMLRRFTIAPLRERYVAS